MIGNECRFWHISKPDSLHVTRLLLISQQEWSE